MALDREAIYSAILDRLAGVEGLAIPPSRRYRDPGSVAPGEMPCLFLCAGGETPEARRDVATTWLLTMTIFVYARTVEPEVPPTAVLVPLVTAVEKALEYQPGDGVGQLGAPGTLGGLVSRCWITDVEYVEGSDSGQGSAFIDIEVRAVNQP